jgi:hypothetical protein
MFRTYFRVKRMVVLGIGAIILFQIGVKELAWGTSYVETLATIGSMDRTCADGRGGRLRYVECGEALPGADRRTVMELSYVSPADGRRHVATIRCDTRAEETPGWLVGQQMEVLAHKSEPERMDRRKCKTVPGLFS